mmetsp:Transcript_78464/g.219495  ORF Transcript_78464/g.219495 Transcript_78464/m.219495 type:complete len:840 (-) Transcript_78464:476-2995(-)
MRVALLTASWCLARCGAGARAPAPDTCGENEGITHESPDGISLFQRFVANSVDQTLEMFPVVPEPIMNFSDDTGAQDLESASVLARAYALLQSYVPPRVLEAARQLTGEGNLTVLDPASRGNWSMPAGLLTRSLAVDARTNLTRARTAAHGNVSAPLPLGAKQDSNRTGTSAFWKTWAPELDVAELENDLVKFPEGSDIWNMSLNWTSVTVRHPPGVISHVFGKRVPIWADVSYLSMDVLYLVSLIAYPVVSVCLLLILTIMASLVMAQNDQPLSSTAQGEQDGDYWEGPVEEAAFAVKNLTEDAKRAFGYWALFCRSIPALMVFGTPVVLTVMTYPYPQEVYTLLVLVSSVMVFSNGVYMVFYCPFTLGEMRQKMRMPPRPSLDPVKAADAEAVVHWVVFPNYKEDFDILCEAIDSVGQSSIARSQICVLLAMEAREEGAAEKAERLQDKYRDTFREIAMTLHPPDLPNDPAGKASNMAWAFKWLCNHVSDTGGDPANVIVTVSDADSDFHKCYFDSLANSFAETPLEKRHITLWQSPIFHVKNYHRQPMPLIVGTMFTAMAEIAVLSDPNAVRFPYSTYSLSMNLATHVGGWDPEWIAEDWHMGIKCFLLTLGESQVQPILLPTVNYMPEEDSWLGTCYARWQQAKRHALGFSDMAYYFMMLPLIFTQLSKPRKDGKDLRDFWKLFFSGLAYIVRLVNTHVIVGIMTLYMAISFMLKNVMIILLQDTRNVGELFERSKGACSMFMCASVLTAAVTTLSFQVVYGTLQDRMAPAKESWRKLFEWKFTHWIYTIAACMVYAMVYAVGLGVAVWIAAVKVLCLKSFAYEVAAKPTAASKV